MRKKRASIYKLFCSKAQSTSNVLLQKCEKNQRTLLLYNTFVDFSFNNYDNLQKFFAKILCKVSVPVEFMILWYVCTSQNKEIKC